MKKIWNEKEYRCIIIHILRVFYTRMYFMISNPYTGRFMGENSSSCLEILDIHDCCIFFVRIHTPSPNKRFQSPIYISVLCLCSYVYRFMIVCLCIDDEWHLYTSLSQILHNTMTIVWRPYTWQYVHFGNRKLHKHFVWLKLHVCIQFACENGANLSNLSWQLHLFLFSFWNCIYYLNAICMMYCFRFLL